MNNDTFSEGNALIIIMYRPVGNFKFVIWFVLELIT